MERRPEFMRPAQRWKKIFLIVATVLVPNLLIMWSTSAQAAVSTSNFGIGRGDGLEIGINLANLNVIRADINAGVYDRPCTAAEHNPNKWHTLVNVEAKCHYDHHHGDDPNYVNDLFGEPGGWYGRPGESVSYPWQTFKAATATEPNDQYVANKQMENDLKHEGYTWVVRRDQPCPEDKACITDFRLQFHGIFGAHDAVVRWHSFSFEGRLCNKPSDPSTCGIYRTGGWNDFGRLFITQPDVIECGHAVNAIYIPLAADTLYFPLDRPEARDEIRCHPTIRTLPAYPSQRPLMEWWGGGSSHMRFQIRSYDPIGNIRQDAPDQWLFHCTLEDVNCRYDQTITTAFIGYVLSIPEFIDDARSIRVDSNGDGRTDYKGWTDRFSQDKTGCTQTSLDCIPVEYNNIPLNYFFNKEAQYFHHPCNNCAKMDYDISPPGKKWNTWFFTKYTGAGHGGDHGTDPTPIPPTPVPPTPPPGSPAIVVEVSPTDAVQGQTINVALKLYNVSGVYGLQTQCLVDPAILKGTARADGDGFNSNNSFFVDNGFQPGGSWLVAASRIQPNTAIQGNATAFTLAYDVVGIGDGKLACSALAVDQNGHDLALEVINGSYISQPIITEEPPTEVPVEPTPTNTPDPAMLSTISGIARYQNRPNNAGILVEIYKPDQTKVSEVVTGTDGGFSFGGLAIGSYNILITAPQHIPSLAPVVVDADGKIIDAGTTVLSAGDTDDDGKIDIVDATFIGANFGLEGADTPANADLNSDDRVNISDLALVGGNYGLQSPTLPQ